MSARSVVSGGLTFTTNIIVWTYFTVVYWNFFWIQRFPTFDTRKFLICPWMFLFTFNIDTFFRHTILACCEVYGKELCKGKLLVAAVKCDD